MKIIQALVILVGFSLMAHAGLLTDLVNSAAPGDTILVPTGDYAERVRINTEGLNLVADGDVTCEGFLIYADNVTIDGFDIFTTETVWLGGGIWVSADGLTVQNCNFENIPYSGIQFTWSQPWPENCVIQNNRMFRCQFGMIIFGNNHLVEGNIVERPTRHTSSDCDYSRFFGENIVFRGNMFFGARADEVGTSHVDGMQTYTNNGYWARNILIEQNYFESFNQAIILGGEPGTLGSMQDIVIRNNVIVGGELGGSWGILPQYDVRNLEIYHNTFVGMKHHGIGTKGNCSLTVQNNIFHDAGSNYWVDETSTLVGGYNLISVPSWKDFRVPTDIVEVDPLLDENYRLTANSPAIDAGIGVGVMDDMLGNPRGLSPDLGAFEFGAVEPDEPDEPDDPDDPEYITAEELSTLLGGYVLTDDLDGILEHTHDSVAHTHPEYVTQEQLNAILNRVRGAL